MGSSSMPIPPSLCPAFTSLRCHLWKGMEGGKDLP